MAKSLLERKLKMKFAAIWYVSIGGAYGCRCTRLTTVNNMLTPYELEILTNMDNGKIKYVVCSSGGCCRLTRYNTYECLLACYLQIFVSMNPKVKIMRRRTKAAD